MKSFSNIGRGGLIVGYILEVNLSRSDSKVLAFQGICNKGKISQ